MSVFRVGGYTLDFTFWRLKACRGISHRSDDKQDFLVFASRMHNEEVSGAPNLFISFTTESTSIGNVLFAIAMESRLGPRREAVSVRKRG